MPRFINHVTLNTGHIRKSFPNEINPNIFFVLSQIKRKIFSPDGAEVAPGYLAKGTEEKGNGALITIYDQHGIPILTTGITKYDHSTIWKLLHETTTVPLQTNPNDPPKAPYVADRGEIGAILNMNAMTWTGDFSRSIAWIYLFPNEILPSN